MTRAVDLARGKWTSVLTALGISPDALSGKHGPCPKDGAGTDRFRFADRNSTGSYFCSCSDGTRGGMGLLMCCKGISYAEAARQVESVVANAEESPPIAVIDPRKTLRRIQDKLKPPGQAVSAYLAARGLEPTAATKQARVPYWSGGQKVGEYDAMVALVTAPDGSPLTFHVTYLDGDKKAALDAPRKLMTPIAPLNGGAIRLMPMAEEMGIAEGIETALAASALFRIPVWACVNEALLSAFEPPSIVKTLWVFGDSDENYVGQHAAYACARRLSKRGIECAVSLPPMLGSDFNDVLLKRVAA